VSVGIEAGFAMLFSIVADVRSFLAVFVLVYALIIIFFILSTGSRCPRTTA